MEFFEVIRSRRSIRRFEPRPVEPELLDQLLESARICQSADNRQPWRFLPISGEDLNAVSDIVLSLFEEREVPREDDAFTSQFAARVIRNAPLLILCFYERTNGRLDSDYLSIGAAMEHICLTATDLGLGAVWIGDTFHTKEKIAAYVGHPELTLVGCIAVGHPAEHPDPRPRKTMDEILLEKQ